MTLSIQFDDAGIKPVRASGSRRVSHNLSAMKRVLSNFGAYSSHLIALAEDTFIKAIELSVVSTASSGQMLSTFLHVPFI